MKKITKLISKFLLLLKDYDPYYRESDIENYNSSEDIVIAIYSGENGKSQHDWNKIRELLDNEGVEYTTEIIVWGQRYYKPIYAIYIKDPLISRTLKICCLNKDAETRNKEITKNWRKLIG